MTKQPTKRRWSHEQFGYAYKAPEPGIFIHAWRGDTTTQVPLEDAESLRCSEDGCDATWRTPGGLSRPGGIGHLRCSKHRVEFDHGKLRQDLRDAWHRVSDKAVFDERERIVRLLEQHPPQQVYQMLVAERSVQSP